MHCQTTDGSADNANNKSPAIAPSNSDATYAPSQNELEKKSKSDAHSADAPSQSEPSSLLEELINRFNQPAPSGSGRSTESTANKPNSNKIIDILFNMNFSNIQVTDITNKNNTQFNIGQVNNIKQDINRELVLLKPNSKRGRTLKNIMSTIERLEAAINASPGSELDKMYRGVGYGVEDLEKCAELTDALQFDVRKNTYTKEEVDTIRDQLKQEILDEVQRSGVGSHQGSMGAVSTRMHENQVVQEKINETGDSCVVQPLLSKGSAINVLDYTKVGSIMPKFVYYEA